MPKGAVVPGRFRFGYDPVCFRYPLQDATLVRHVPLSRRLDLRSMIGGAAGIVELATTWMCAIAIRQRKVSKRPAVIDDHNSLSKNVLQMM